jgi:hypothetical protein
MSSLHAVKANVVPAVRVLMSASFTKFFFVVIIVNFLIVYTYLLFKSLFCFWGCPFWVSVRAETDVVSTQGADYYAFMFCLCQ